MSAIAAMVLYWICAGLILVGVGVVLLPILWVIDALAVWSSCRKHNAEREKLLRTAVSG